MEYLKLNNGTEIPSAGIGTFLLQPDDAEAAVRSALGDGYQLVDTANAYMNEKAVGRAIKKSGVEREKVYLSTKLWPSVYKTADQAVDATLKRLDTEYIDLMFLHQPVGDYVAAYRAMERAVKAGKIRSLGLSNFSEDQIREVADATEIKPAVLQAEAHPYYPQTALKEYLDGFGAHVMAWYPLGHGDKALLNEPVIADIAQKHGKTRASGYKEVYFRLGGIAPFKGYAVFSYFVHSQSSCSNTQIFFRFFHLHTHCMNLYIYYFLS